MRLVFAEQCPLRAREQIKDPYLRGAFRFLTSSGSPFREVLEGPDLPMQDKIGFACRFLADDQARDSIEYSKVIVIALIHACRLFILIHTLAQAVR